MVMFSINMGLKWLGNWGLKEKGSNTYMNTLFFFFCQVHIKSPTVDACNYQHVKRLTRQTNNYY